MILCALGLEVPHFDYLICYHEILPRCLHLLAIPGLLMMVSPRISTSSHEKGISEQYMCLRKKKRNEKRGRESIEFGVFSY